MNATIHDVPELLAFDAELSMQQVNDREATAHLDDRNRRLMLAVLTRSGRQLYEGFSTDPDGSTIVEVVESIQTYEKQLQTLLELSGAAIARMLAVASVILQQDGAADAKGGA